MKGSSRESLEGRQPVSRGCRAAVLLAALLLCAAAPAGLAAAPERVVRVGYAPLQGFLFEGPNGSYGGMAYEILQEIALHCDWRYELVETNYRDAKDLLESGRIELFVTYQKTAGRAALYEYSREVFCTNRASLLTLPESPVCYEDYEGMRGLVVGGLIGSRNSGRFAEFLLGKGCRVTVKDGYPDQKSLIEALKTGEIGAFISASNRGIRDCRIVAVLPETDSYMIAKKGDRSLLDQADMALRKISASMPDFWYGLNEKYQVSASGAWPSLTREERDYVARKKTVTVLVARQDCDRDGKLQGSAKTVFQEIARTTGLQFTPVIAPDTKDLLSEFARGKADMVGSFVHDYEWAARHNAWISRSYVTFFNKLAVNPRAGGVNRIATVPGTYMAYHLAKSRGGETVFCSSYEECLDLVLAGEADAVYCTLPLANYYSTFPKYRSLQFLSIFNFASSYCMAVSKSSDAVLVDVLDKALLVLPGAMIAQAFDEQVRSRVPSLLDWFYLSPRRAAAAVLAAAALAAFLFSMLFYALATKRKNRELAMANRAKTDFMSRMSHDMRTPMNGILGLAALSKDEGDPAVLKENLRQVELSGRYLLSLINDTLDMNKIEQGRLELRLSPIDSEEILGNMLSHARLLASEKGVKLDLRLSIPAPGQWPPVMADASRLEQVLINVISNAVKYTPPGGTVMLSMETLSADENFVRDRYVVRDTGIGMSEDFLPRLFEPFSQEGRADAGAEGGSGLGMAIVKQLVELMHGTISVKSRMGEGTEVTLEIQYPLWRGASAPVSQPVAGAPLLRGKRVLVCEDHPLNAKIVMKLLEKQGMLPCLACDGKAGVDLFEHSPLWHYDLILLDVRMPVMDGLEAARAIRRLRRPDAKSVPVIAMTANAFNADVRNCLAAGMNAHLAKPLDPAALFQTMARCLGAALKKRREEQ